MDRPGVSLLVSIAVHVVVVGGIALALLFGPARTALPMPDSVPVSIVSETLTVEAGPADAPTEDAEVASDSATAPPPTAPEPPPPVEVPVPSPRPPEKAPAPRPNAQPKRNPPPSQPPPANKGPARPPADELCLTCIAGERTNSRQPNNPNRQPPAGQQGRGNAPRAIGRASLQALAAQVTPHWAVNCNQPGADNLTINVRVTLDENGRIVGAPRAIQSSREPVWRAASESVLRAIRAAAPFDMPSGYEQQEIPFEFRTATMCSR